MTYEFPVVVRSRVGLIRAITELVNALMDAVAWLGRRILRWWRQRHPK